MFGCVRRKENKWWGSGIFSPYLSKSFFLKMKRKLGRENSWNELPKIPLEFTSKSPMCFFFSFSFDFFSVTNVCWLPSSFFFFFFFFLFYFIFLKFFFRHVGFFFSFDFFWTCSFLLLYFIFWVLICLFSHLFWFFFFF